jgi:SAM-dependent methyltransferase
MTEIRSGTYDTATCFAVLEHVPDPLISFKELARVLKPQGKLILTVPHLSRLHEEPHDYFRFTKYGIKTALESVGFDILELKPVGGFFCFLGHQISIVFLGLLWHVPIVKNIALWINKLLIVELAIFLDKIVDKGKLFAMDYICVSQKK